MEVDDSNGCYADCDDDTEAFLNEDRNEKLLNLKGAHPKEPMSKQTATVKSWKECCVPTCGRTYESWPQIRLFKFPHNALLCKIWLTVCDINIENFDSKRSLICDAHFKPGQLGNPSQIQQIVPSKYRPDQIEQQYTVSNSSCDNLPDPTGLVKFNDTTTNKAWQNLNKEDFREQNFSRHPKNDHKIPKVCPNRNSRACCVPNCGRSYRTCTNIRIYRFPADVNTRRAWLEACRISPAKYNTITSTFGVCDAHFLPRELMRRLPSETIPTQNLPERLEQEDAVQCSAEKEADQTRNGTDHNYTNDRRRYGRKCCVPNCGRSYRTSSKIRIFKFPADVNTRRAWLEACGISPAEYNSISTVGVCDAHFQPHELSLRLRRGTVPTLNLQCSAERMADQTVLEAATVSPTDTDIVEEPRIHKTPRPKIKYLTVSPKCCIASCGRILYKCPGMVMYKFPQDEATRRAWCDACGISEADYKATNQTAGVCDAHFLPGELSDILAPGIVPTQNLTGEVGTMSEATDLCRESDEDRSGDRRKSCRKCYVPNCGRSYRTSKNIRLYRIPPDKERRRVWLKACGISLDEYYAFNGMVSVCDAHFLPHELLLRLRRETVPTQNLPGGLAAGYQDDAPDETESEEEEDCDFCLYSERRADVYRHRHKRIKAKLAALKTKYTEAKKKLRPLKSELAFQRQPDLRRPSGRAKMKEILRNVSGMSKSGQVMFRMLVKPIQSWDEEEKQLSLNLYHKAPIPFRFFAQKLKLHVPSRKTIIRWAELENNPECPNTPRNHKKSPRKKRRKNGKGNTKTSEVVEIIPQSPREDELVLEIPETETMGYEDSQGCDLVHEEYEVIDSEDLIYESPEYDDIIYESDEGEDIVYEELDEGVPNFTETLCYEDIDMNMDDLIVYTSDSDM